MLKSKGSLIPAEDSSERTGRNRSIKEEGVNTWKGRCSAGGEGIDETLYALLKEGWESSREETTRQGREGRGAGRPGKTRCESKGKSGLDLIFGRNIFIGLQQAQPFQRRTGSTWKLPAPSPPVGESGRL